MPGSQVVSQGGVKGCRRAVQPGLYYDLGLAPHDDVGAVKWYRKAADQDHVSSEQPGAMPGNGTGVRQWGLSRGAHRKAADQGDPLAQDNLGHKYTNGEGVPQDYVEAYKWYSLAASRLPASANRDQVVKKRDLVATKMTPQQISAAQTLARDWKSKR